MIDFRTKAFLRKSIAIVEGEEEPEDDREDEGTGEDEGGGGDEEIGDRKDPPPSLQRSEPKDGEDGGGEEPPDGKDNNPGKKSKETARYKEFAPDPDKRCEKCESFEGPDGCVIVDGGVDSDGTCALFEPKNPKKGE